MEDDLEVWLNTLRVLESGRVLSAANRQIVEQIKDAAGKLSYHPLAAKIAELATELLKAAELPEETKESAAGTRLSEVIVEELGKWVLYSADGKKKLGEFATKAEAEEREREIERMTKAEESTEPHGDAKRIEEREFSAEKRRELADEGKALPDGSFPIVTRADLQNAVSAFGRGGHPILAKKHIIKRAKELGATDALPEDWQEGLEEAEHPMPDDKDIYTMDMFKERMQAARAAGASEDDVLDALMAAMHKSREDMQRVISGKMEATPAAVKAMVEAMDQLKVSAHGKTAAKPGGNVKEAAEPSWEQTEELIRLAVAKRHGAFGQSGEPVPWVTPTLATYADRVVYRDREGKTWESSWSLENGDVVLGDPVPVVATFERVSEANQSFTDSAPYVQVLEAADKTGREWDVILIQAGLSKNGNYYPAEALQKAASLFEGAYAFADHATDAEREARPERSVKDKVGRFSNVQFGKFPIGGKVVEGLKARFKVIAPWMREVMLEAVKAGEPDFLGFSIDAEGKVTPKQVDGRRVNWIEQIVRVHSVDVVTDPAAGGRVVRLVASNRGVEGMEEQELKDLIAAQIREVVGTSVREALATVQEPALSEEDKAALQRLRAEHERRANEQRIDTALADTNLSDIGRRHLRNRLVEALGRRDLSDEEIAAEVKEQVEYEAQFVQSRPLSIAEAQRLKVGDSEHDKYVKALTGWFQGGPVDGVKPFGSLRESYCRWEGVDAFDMNPLEMWSSLCSRKYDSAVSHKRLKESLTTASWGEVFADVLYLQMIKEYQASPEYAKWKLLVSDIESVADFQTRHWVRIGGYGDLSTVSEQATYPTLTSPTDEEVTYVIAKRGGLDDVTLEMLTYDRGAAKVRKIPVAMARAAVRTLFKFVLNLVTTDNPSMDYDSTTLYHADHSNTGTTALSLDGLRATVQAMRDQTAYNESNEILGERNVPKFLIVPNELEFRAKRIIGPSAQYAFGLDYPTGTGNIRADQDISIDPQAFAGMGLQVIVYDVLTDANDWFAAADPTRVPTVAMGFWNGAQEPELFVQDNPTEGSVFTADKITYKVRHVYGGDVLDHRAFYRQVVT